MHILKVHQMAHQNLYKQLSVEISQEYNHSESAFVRTVRNKAKLVPVDTVA